MLIVNKIYLSTCEFMTGNSVIGIFKVFFVYSGVQIIKLISNIRPCVNAMEHRTTRSVIPQPH